MSWLWDLKLEIRRIPRSEFLGNDFWLHSRCTGYPKIYKFEYHLLECPIIDPESEPCGSDRLWAPGAQLVRASILVLRIWRVQLLPQHQDPPSNRVFKVLVPIPLGKIVFYSPDPEDTTSSNMETFQSPDTSSLHWSCQLI